MAEKIKINEYGDCTFTEQDAIDLLYNNPEFDISKLFFDDVEKYTSSLKELGLDLPTINTLPGRETLSEFDNKNINDWHMPEKYYQIMRGQTEYSLFEKKKFVRVLQFLIYFVDTLRANNVVWGVGRGSSVASFCLFLIGVHKINPLLYNLDHTEFLR